MTTWQETLRICAAQLGCTITADQEEKLASYLDLLLERNRQMNLTAITDPVEVAVKHFVDSLTVEMVWQPHAGDKVIDIGTGAGLPGIPIAIRHPDVQVVLNDSTRKKVDFLSEVIMALHLDNARAVWARAEELGRSELYRGQFNVVFARAVAHLAVLAEYALPLLKMGGMLIALKGPGGEAEIEESQQAFQHMGGVVTNEQRINIVGAGERRLIVIQKKKPTPAEFPRNPGQARKHPLYLDSQRRST